MATHVGIFSMKSHHFNTILFYTLEDVLIVITKITRCRLLFPVPVWTRIDLLEIISKG